jgi:hypothetical protein
MGQVIQIDEARIRDHLELLVGRRKTLNAMRCERQTSSAALAVTSAALWRHELPPAAKLVRGGPDALADWRLRRSAVMVALPPADRVAQSPKAKRPLALANRLGPMRAARFTRAHLLCRGTHGCPLPRPVDSARAACLCLCTLIQPRCART